MAAKKKSSAKKKPAQKAKPAPTAKPAAKPKPTPKPSVSQFVTAEGGPWGKCFLPRAKGEKRFWLVKSEPDVFSWDDLQKAPGKTTHWNGVRNFAARNFMRDGMKLGDLVLFYHSSVDPQVIVGIAEVVREGYPDHTAFDAKDHGYDADSSPAAPTWYMVDLRAVEAFKTPVSLPAIKATRSLADMALLRIGRLSVIPVTSADWNTIVAMGRR
jgi:predicted RNA-binding protein with PUA-like domain